MKASRVMLGASSVVGGVPRFQASSPNEDDNADVQSFGEVPVYCGIGFTSYPAPKDANGWAEGILFEGSGKPFIGGGRDTRNVAFLGRSDPGDTYMHSTGSNRAVQFRAQDKKRIGAIVVRDSAGKDMLFTLDGEKRKFSLMVNGAAIQIDDAGNVAIKGGSELTLAAGSINLNGEIHIPGMPPGMFLMAGPVAGVVGVSGAAVPVMGVGGFSFSGLLQYAALVALGWAHRFANWACAKSRSRASRLPSPA